MADYMQAFLAGHAPAHPGSIMNDTKRAAEGAYISKLVPESGGLNADGNPANLERMIELLQGHGESPELKSLRIAYEAALQDLDHAERIKAFAEINDAHFPAELKEALRQKYEGKSAAPVDPGLDKPFGRPAVPPPEGGRKSRRRRRKSKKTRKSKRRH